MKQNGKGDGTIARLFNLSTHRLINLKVMTQLVSFLIFQLIDSLTHQLMNNLKVRQLVSTLIFQFIDSLIPQLINSTSRERVDVSAHRHVNLPNPKQLFDLSTERLSKINLILPLLGLKALLTQELVDLSTLKLVDLT